MKNRMDEIENKFKCLVCGRDALRGKYVKTEKGPLKGREAHVCKSDECQESLRSGKGWNAALKLILGTLVLVIASGCAQQQASPAAAVSNKPIGSIWTISEPSTAFDRNTVPFYRIVMVSRPFGSPFTAEVLSLPTSNGCDSTVSLQGTESSGFTSVTTADVRPECTAYNGQTVTFQRVDALTMKFCIGTYCASYQ